MTILSLIYLIKRQLYSIVICHFTAECFLVYNPDKQAKEFILPGRLRYSIIPCQIGTDLRRDCFYSTQVLK